MTQDGQVINTASASLRELKTRLVLVRTKIAGLDREEATVDVTVRDQQAGGIEPRARGVAGHGDWMGNGGEAQPLDNLWIQPAFFKKELLGLRVEGIGVVTSFLKIVRKSIRKIIQTTSTR